jgi:hypothetical protein
VALVVPGFGPTWCYSVEWNVKTATGSVPIKGVLHGTMH